MIGHTRLSPGIELHEIDRSQYGEKIDYSITGTVTFMAGFTNKGTDSAVQWVNTKNLFVNQFGLPTNEVELYLYNGMCEILNRGGICLVAKLPYDNDSYNKYVYVDYELESVDDDFNKRYLKPLNAKDGSIIKCTKIKNIGEPGTMTIDELDACRVQNSIYQNSSLPYRRNTIRIVDITRNQLGKAYLNEAQDDGRIKPVEKQCIGICPVLLGALNGAAFQRIIDSDTADFNPIGSLVLKIDNDDAYQVEQSAPDSLEYELSSQTADNKSMSMMAANGFPPMNWISPGRLERAYLDYVCLVVFQIFIDEANESKLSMKPLEIFYGSLNKKSKNERTGASDYICNIVNEQSNYVNMFSNIDSASPDANSDIYACINQKAYVLGFSEKQCEKKISYEKSIVGPLTRILGRMEDPNQVPLDIIADAGVSNIAQWVKWAGAYASVDADMYPYIDKDGNPIKYPFEPQTPSAWATILKKYDDFCKNVRKDCMFIADCPRNLVLEGNQKIVRNTNFYNTIENKILSNMQYLAVLNSSYSAGYCNWFRVQDESSAIQLWLPPSIKMAGVYTYTDAYFHTWNAPAGLTRGVIRDAIDVSFNPMNDQAGRIYQQAWNYAVNYPIDGIVAEGQKTFQLQHTALDRINVRRLMLYLEKSVVIMARRFLYEGNTEYTRQRFIDQISPIFEDAQNGEGISEFAIKCDDELNTSDVIENHELRCIIGVKPVKSIEWIRIDFIVTNQSADVQEEVLR